MLLTTFLQTHKKIHNKDENNILFPLLIVYA